MYYYIKLLILHLLLIIKFELGWIFEGDSKELSTGPKSRGPSVNTLMDILNTSDLCLLYVNTLAKSLLLTTNT